MYCTGAGSPPAIIAVAYMASGPSEELRVIDFDRDSFAVTAGFHFVLLGFGFDYCNLVG